MVVDKIGIEEINTVLLYIQRELKSINERITELETALESAKEQSEENE